MKKKCTYSGCRKVFSYNPEEVVACPHCGKEYPKLRNRRNRLLCDIDGVVVDLTELKKEREAIQKGSRVRATKTVRDVVGHQNARVTTCLGIAEYMKKTGKCPLKVYPKSFTHGRVRVVKSVRIW